MHEASIPERFLLSQDHHSRSFFRTVPVRLFRWRSPHFGFAHHEGVRQAVERRGGLPGRRNMQRDPTRD
jgi:hypothetical protein